MVSVPFVPLTLAVTVKRRHQVSAYRSNDTEPAKEGTVVARRRPRTT
jgi:hypothetical protein